ncbi:hypothetical protein OUZ56_011357 [Daphnia magna]|uniref:Uncharacterized protein n=1 Tax=Daphnia magna TaxID=35525 RepID=A0ABQ9YZX5_9CRUS|nr:hypothetical protein OUZ56_011357 [Daphnia magna]
MGHLLVMATQDLQLMAISVHLAILCLNMVRLHSMLTQDRQILIAILVNPRILRPDIVHQLDIAIQDHQLLMDMSYNMVILDSQRYFPILDCHLPLSDHSRQLLLTALGRLFPLTFLERQLQLPILDRWTYFKCIASLHPLILWYEWSSRWNSDGVAVRNLQRVQDARLIAIDRRFDNLQQFQQQYPSNDPVTEIPGLPVKTLDELVAFEKKIKINENFFEFVSSFHSYNWWHFDGEASWGIRETLQFRAVQESELIVETKKALNHAPERVRQVAAAAVAGTVYSIGYLDDKYTILYYTNVTFQLKLECFTLNVSLENA